jgi:hypothetical protein
MKQQRVPNERAKLRQLLDEFQNPALGFRGLVFRSERSFL